MEQTSRHPNVWQHPDERFEGLLKIANAINDGFDLATGEAEVVRESEFAPDAYPMWTPLRLAERMRSAAQRIEEATERYGVATPSFDSAPAVDRKPRCWRCRKKLANYLARPWDIDCVRCKAKNVGPPAGREADFSPSTPTAI